MFGSFDCLLLSYENPRDAVAELMQRLDNASTDDQAGAGPVYADGDALALASAGGASGTYTTLAGLERIASIAGHTYDYQAVPKPDNGSAGDQGLPAYGAITRIVDLAEAANSETYERDRTRDYGTHFAHIAPTMYEAVGAPTGKIHPSAVGNKANEGKTVGPLSAHQYLSATPGGEFGTDTDTDTDTECIPKTMKKKSRTVSSE